MPVRPETQQRIQTAQQLARQGHTTYAIATSLGIAPSTAARYLRDPDGHEARAGMHALRGTCTDCGQPTSGTASGTPRTLCTHCKGRLIRRWDKPTIHIKIRDWTKRYGRPPTATDWNSTRAHTNGGQALDRWNSDTWPPAATVTRIYGRFGVAIALGENTT
jgi:hypothetical protein